MTKNYFNEEAEIYSKARPSYPEAFFEYLFSRCANFQTAWDVATGNAQIALRLADNFQEVIATDISAKQIAVATRRDNITYKVEPAEYSSIADQSIDLVTIGQGVHWFNLDNFYAEVRRVAKCNCIITAVGYRMFTINPVVDSLLADYIHNILNGYWDPTNDQLQNAEYRSVYFPFIDVEYKVFNLHLSWNVTQVLACLASYSASRAYYEKNKIIATSLITKSLEKLMGLNVWDVTLPIYGKVGRVW